MLKNAIAVLDGLGACEACDRALLVAMVVQSFNIDTLRVNNCTVPLDDADDCCSCFHEELGCMVTNITKALNDDLLV